MSSRPLEDVAFIWPVTDSRSAACCSFVSLPAVSSAEETHTPPLFFRPTLHSVHWAALVHSAQLDAQAMHTPAVALTYSPLGQRGLHVPSPTLGTTSLGTAHAVHLALSPAMVHEAHDEWQGEHAPPVPLLAVMSSPRPTGQTVKQLPPWWIGKPDERWQLEHEAGPKLSQLLQVASQTVHLPVVERYWPSGQAS